MTILLSSLRRSPDELEGAPGSLRFLHKGLVLTRLSQSSSSLRSCAHAVSFVFLGFFPVPQGAL